MAENNFSALVKLVVDKAQARSALQKELKELQKEAQLETDVKVNLSDVRQARNELKKANNEQIQGTRENIKLRAKQLANARMVLKEEKLRTDQENEANRRSLLQTKAKNKEAIEGLKQQRLLLQENRKLEDEKNKKTSNQKKIDKTQYSLDTEKYSSDIKKVNDELKSLGKVKLTDQSDIDVLTKAKTSAESLGKTYKEMQTIYTDKSGKFTDQQKIEIEQKYQKELTTTKNLLSQISNVKDNELVSVGDDRRINMIATLNTYLSKNTAMTKASKKQIEEWIAKLSSSDDMTVGAIKNINSEFKQLDASLRSSGKLGLSVWDKFKQAFQKFGGWSLVTGAMRQAVQSMKEAVNSAVTLDSALTNINYTMDVSSDKLAKVGQESLATAKELKTSAENVLSAVTTYANAKETVDSILSKATPTIMLSNVSGMDTATTADILQGAIHQFDLEDTEESLLHVSDVLQTVSQSMSVDFAKGIREMADGIQVSGSVAKDAGYDLEAYSSLLGNLIEKTRQSGSELGRSLRTMFVRTTKASTSALAGGEVTEDDLSNAEAALGRVGIQVRDTKDSFREFDDIMTDLYNKIDDLSEVDLANIAYEVASTRQTAVFKVMVKSWGDYIGLAEKANDAGGTTFENQEKYAESLKAQMQELSTTMDVAWHNMVNEETISPVLSTLQLLADGLVFVTDKAGLLGTIGLGAGLFAGIKNVGINMLVAC